MLKYYDIIIFYACLGVFWMILGTVCRHFWKMPAHSAQNHGKATKHPSNHPKINRKCERCAGIFQKCLHTVTRIIQKAAKHPLRHTKSQEKRYGVQAFSKIACTRCPESSKKLPNMHGILYYYIILIL